MNNKKAPWRILVGIAAIAYIIYMWVDKDLLSLYAGIPTGQLLPMAATSTAVTLVKVGILAAAVCIIKKLLRRH